MQKLSNRYYDFRFLDECHAEFQANHYVKLPGFLDVSFLNELKNDVCNLEMLRVRRSFLMEEMDNSPRRMATLGGHVITSSSMVIPQLYEDGDIFDVVSSIFGEPVETVTDLVERYVLNFLEQDGDVHGAHFDDYPLALILFIESPTAGQGGVLEYVPNARRLTELDTSAVRRAVHQAGDAYLLKTDTTAHRVTPLTAHSRRVVINMAYATATTNVQRTSTADKLYA